MFSFSSHQMHIINRTVLTVAEFKAQVTPFEPPPDIAIDELERKYWKNIGFSKPLYGSDLPGSLIDKCPNAASSSWNLNSLNTLLSRVLGPTTVVPGVTRAYLYFGSWKSSFAWHVEDMNLFSINYHHGGACKVTTLISVKCCALKICARCGMV